MNILLVSVTEGGRSGRSAFACGSVARLASQSSPQLIVEAPLNDDGAFGAVCSGIALGTRPRRVVQEVPRAHSNRASRMWAVFIDGRGPVGWLVFGIDTGLFRASRLDRSTRLRARIGAITSPTGRTDPATEQPVAVGRHG